MIRELPIVLLSAFTLSLLCSGGFTSCPWLFDAAHHWRQISKRALRLSFLDTAFMEGFRLRKISPGFYLWNLLLQTLGFSGHASLNMFSFTTIFFLFNRLVYIQLRMHDWCGI